MANLKPLILVCILLGVPWVTTLEASDNRTAHAFTFVSIDGGELRMRSLAGKAILVVNTASRCGFTRQYAALQALWSNYRGRGLVVLGVPSNDFGGQEPGNESDIKEFCEVNFNIDFPLTGKVIVKGKAAHPFYRWVVGELGAVSKPRWNFHKYLIGPTGEALDWFAPTTAPNSKRIVRAIEAALPTTGM